MDRTRRRLDTERAQTLRRLARLTGDHDDMVAAARDSNADDEHDPEGATIAFERSQLDSMVERTRSHLQQVDDALDRLTAGSYGICECCAGPVGEARLEAMPTARWCITCATAG